MRLLQEEAELKEIVQLGGYGRPVLQGPADAGSRPLHPRGLSCIRTPSTRVDTYTSLNKQYKMLKLILTFYEMAQTGTEQGCDTLNDLIELPVRESIGRVKYVPRKRI